MTNYWRSVKSVLTGSVIAQLIPVLGSLVIARLYTPAEFGMFSAWLGLVMLLAVLLTCRYDMALAIEKDGVERRLAVLSTLVVTGFVSAFFTIVVFGGVFFLPDLLARYPIVLVLVWLPAALFLATNNIWQSWAAAEGEYRKLSYMRIAQASLITLLQILGGLFLSTASVLALAHLLGLLLALGLSICMLPLTDLPKNRIRSGVVSFWKRQRRFPIFSLPADFINTGAVQLPVLIVTARFGTDISGMLAMTMKVLGAPIGLLGKSVLDVFKRHAAKSYFDRGECREEYVKTFSVLALGSFLFCLIMFFASEPLFIFAFGREWAQAGVIAIWLLPLFALRFVASPLSYMVYIAEKQHLDLIWQIGLLGMTVFCLTTFSEYEVALKTFSWGYGTLYAIYLLMSYRFSLGINR